MLAINIIYQNISVFRLVGELSSNEEKICLDTYLSKSRFLTVFIHRRGANDEIMKTLGLHCPGLQVVKSNHIAS